MKTKKNLACVICEEIWNKKSGWTKNDLKAIRSLHKGFNQAKKQNMAKHDGDATYSEWWSRRLRDLTELARSGQLEPVGRDQEISPDDSEFSVARRRITLSWDAGVGKTALALGLAQRCGFWSSSTRTSQNAGSRLDLMNVVTQGLVSVGF